MTGDRHKKFNNFLQKVKNTFNKTSSVLKFIIETFYVLTVTNEPIMMHINHSSYIVCSNLNSQKIEIMIHLFSLIDQMQTS